MSDQTPYRVERSSTGCSNCNIGSTWQVVYSPLNRSLDVHYGDPQQAEYTADILNQAWNLGRVHACDSIINVCDAIQRMP